MLGLMAAFADACEFGQSAACFYVDMVIEEPEPRWLVIAPANSPENDPDMLKK